MTRGDLVTVALQGDQGKPRPALVLQSDYFAELPTIVVLPITSTLVDAPLIRIPVQPNAENGLSKPSHIMLDKVQATSRTRIGRVIGRIDHVRSHCARA